MIKRLYVLSPLVAGFLLFIVMDVQKKLGSIIPLASYVQYESGDLIFRKGASVESEAVLASRAASEYSHVGLIVRQGKALWVLHAAPAEIKGEFDGVKLEPLALFAQADRAKKIAIMRPFKQAATGVKAVNNALKYLGRPFDTALDLQDDKLIYCTELVARAYYPLHINLYVRLQPVYLPFYKGAYLTPQDMYEKADLQKIATY